jgi:hypothetical protein
MADYGDLGYLLSQRNPNRMQHAGSEIGLALAGGDPLRRAQIESEGALSGARMADVLAQARQRQQQEIGRQNLAEELRKRGDTIGASAVGASSTINPGEIGQYLKHAQEVEAARRNLELADEPTVDYNHLNARKIAMAPGPTELVRSLGDGSYTSNAYNTNVKPELSEIGQAFVKEKGALAGEHNAQAERARAGIGVDKAANWELKDTPDGMVRVNKLTGETVPLSVNGKPVSKAPATPKSFTEHEMAAALSTPDSNGKIDPMRFRQFEAVKDQNRGKGDSDVFAALRQQDAEDAAAASGIGPPKSLAPPVPSELAQLFGAGDGTSNAPIVPGLPLASKASASGKTVVKQVIKNGRKVNVYADGSGDYAD